MSTGKRLAKRSILGTRVACCLEDGKYYPGMICDVKSNDEGGPQVYSVRVEGDRRPRDLREGDLVGSGFTSVSSVKLRPEQKVFITFNNREVSGRTIYHRPNIDEVLISVVNPEVRRACLFVSRARIRFFFRSSERERKKSFEGAPGFGGVWGRGSDYYRK